MATSETAAAERSPAPPVPSVAEAPPRPRIDPREFRDVLGHYPTGVVVVTAVADVGEPVGMVVGSFTSVSLDPPLVAFLPATGSATFARLRTARSFCVNVLAAEQEDLCRRFASRQEDKFDGVAWRPSPSGAPVIDGVVAWIDCDVHGISEAGDHYIVLGEVTTLRVETPRLPLMFFQGGYGRFIPRSLVIPTDRDFIDSIRMAEQARDTIEEIARELQAECIVAVPDRGDSVFAATANHCPRTLGRTRLGARVPIAAPIGPLFVGVPGGVTEEQWLAPLCDSDREAALAQLERVRTRGWSITLYGDHSQAELDAAVQAYSSDCRTPAQERQFRDLMRSMAQFHEPEVVDPDRQYDVLHVGVPVHLPDGSVPMVLRAGELHALTGAQIGDVVRRLQAGAEAVAGRLLAS